jgi:recombination protein RecR
MNREIPSPILQQVVDAFTRLPGIGKKTALRLALHLMKNEDETQHLGKCLLGMDKIRFCERCHNISEAELCTICLNPARDEKLICVVENLRELIAIEGTGQFRGTYHLLGGIISPIDGVGPEDLNIADLIERIRLLGVKELIMALNPTVEGDTTIFYISNLLQKDEVKITTIARGVSFGGELEYVDELTLARSIATRLPFDQLIQRNS